MFQGQIQESKSGMRTDVHSIKAKKIKNKKAKGKYYSLMGSQRNVKTCIYLLSIPVNWYKNRKYVISEV